MNPGAASVGSQGTANPWRVASICGGLAAAGLLISLPGFAAMLVVVWFALAGATVVGVTVLEGEHAECLWWQSASALTWLAFAAVVVVIVRRRFASRRTRSLATLAVTAVTIGPAHLVGHPAASFFPLDCGIRG